MRRYQGQALIEFALITPIFLLLIVGALALGVLVLQRIQMQHAANETAIAAAQHPSGCSIAGSRSAQILGFTPETVECSSGGQLVTIRLVHNFPTIAPLVPTRVVVAGRAVIRSQPVEETPAPEARHVLDRPVSA
jgi:uncharacterized membrane protein